jgi:hypothetical protein
MATDPDVDRDQIAVGLRLGRGGELKIILSRKGFDGTAGGCPSPIVDGRPLSLPIPTKMPTSTRYRDLVGLYGDLVADLTHGRLNGDSRCHADPDIDEGVMDRQPGWRGALGQVAAAQGHLAKQDVQTGDLFIFWGLFREVVHDARWKFVGLPEHRIWGWLQIGEIIQLGADGSHALRERPWLSDHPHVRPGWGPQNVLYVASDSLSLGGQSLDLAGSGVLARGHRLTADNQQPSKWRAPDWLHPLMGGCGMTYHPPERWAPDGTVQSAARGQEFVAAPTAGSGALEWLKAILTEAG